MCPSLCPLLCPTGYIFCCALLYIINVPPLSLSYIFNKYALLCAPPPLYCKLNPKYYVKTNAPTFAPNLGAYFHAPTFI